MPPVTASHGTPNLPGGDRNMWTAAFWRDLAERVVATFAEALAALLLASGVGLLDVGWVDSLSLAGMTALVSLLKGVAAYKLGDNATGASALSSPPPRVESGHTDVVVILLAVVVVLLVLIGLGVL